MDSQDKEIIQKVKEIPDEILSVSKNKLLNCATESKELRRAIALLVPDLKLKLPDNGNAISPSDIPYDLYAMKYQIPNKYERFLTTEHFKKCGFPDIPFQVRGSRSFAGKALYLNTEFFNFKIIKDEAGVSILVILPN